MSTFGTFSRGILTGLALMYFADPRRGRQRRARFANQLTHLWRAEKSLVGKATRDARSRAGGALDRLAHTSQRSNDDVVVEQRVRSSLGRIVPYASAIDTEVRAGIATMRGPVLERHANLVIGGMRMVRGVRGVIDRLDRHQTEDVPELRHHVERRGAQWTPAAQVGAIAAGASLVGFGFWTSGPWRAALFAAGGALVTRGAVNQPANKILRYLVGKEPITVRKMIFVACPIERVFAAWSHLENLPRFMDHVKSIEIDPLDRTRAKWSVDGPAGIPLKFTTTTNRVVENREIVWSTTADQRIEHAGSVRFTAGAGGTRVHIEMQYRPLGGVLAHAIAHLVGWDPKGRLDEDMLRMKTLLEQGHTRAHKHTVTEGALLH
jgi:uncharacterized membrane protein